MQLERLLGNKDGKWCCSSIVVKITVLLSTNSD